jgi:hypothetical protein
MLSKVFGLLVFAAALPAWAQEYIGQVKNASGTVMIERGSSAQPTNVGDRLLERDVVRTGPDGAVGITFLDNSLVSLGPDSLLALDRFRFDTRTHVGAFDTSLRRGTLAVRSGQIAKQTPEAMTVRTPAAILGVRGTEFVVRAADK